MELDATLNCVQWGLNFQRTLRSCTRLLLFLGVGRSEVEHVAIDKCHFNVISCISNTETRCLMYLMKKGN